MRLFRIFRMGTTREARERAAKAKADLHAAQEAAVLSKRLSQEARAHARENNFALIIRESLQSGHSR